MSACVLVSWAPEATEKSTRIPTPTNRLNSARGSHHTLPDRPRSTASRISRSLCKLRRIRPNQAGQPISGRALRRIVGEADLVFGVFKDANHPRGWDFMIIKGEQALAASVQTKTTVSLKM